MHPALRIKKKTDLVHNVLSKHANRPNTQTRQKHGGDGKNISRSHPARNGKKYPGFLHCTKGSRDKVITGTCSALINDAARSRLMPINLGVFSPTLLSCSNGRSAGLRGPLINLTMTFSCPVIEFRSD